MPTKPLKLRWVTLVVMLMAAFCIFFLIKTLMAPHEPAAPENLPFLFFATLSGVCASVGLYRVELWGLCFVWAFGLGWIAYDLQVLIASPSPFKTEFWVLGLTVVCLMVVSQESVRRLFFDRQLRWWQRPKRHRLELPILITMGSVTFNAKLLDISFEGCLAGVDLELRHGEHLELSLEASNVRFDSRVRVVRKSLNPRGFGLVFVDRERGHHRQLRQLIKTM